MEIAYETFTNTSCEKCGAEINNTTNEVTLKDDEGIFIVCESCHLIIVNLLTLIGE